MNMKDNKKFLLGIDFGGGSSKATLLSTGGDIVAESTAEYPTYYPAGGGCEQRPEDWEAALVTNIRALIEKSGISTSDILCIAVDSATHTAVLCDENNIPLRPAIHWTDSRSVKESKYLNEQYGDEICKISYHRPGTFWTLPQLLWVKNHEPEIFGKIRHIFFEKDYIRYLLTDVFCTDYIEAEGSMLFDCEKLCWSGTLCDIAGIDPACLPDIKNPTDVIGHITPKAASRTGLFEGTPVICGTTDTVMEVFAAGAVKEGDVTVKLATAGRICVITDKPYPHRDLVNYSHIAKGLWYPGTATKSAAASYRWYRDTFGESYKELDAGAEQIEIGCEGLRFHPYLNGELSPYADPLLCGSFTGVRATHTKAHFTRAVLEGVCYSLLDSTQVLREVGIAYGDTAVAIGGGMKGALWRQMTADVLGLTLKVTDSADSSLGSAMLAGIAVGVFKDPAHAAETCVKVRYVTQPIPENTEKYRKVFEEYKRIHDALAPIYEAR